MTERVVPKQLLLQPCSSDISSCICFHIARGYYHVDITKFYPLLGGIPAKMQGRIGDTPMIGCGGYANEYGGCSTTGHGESLMKMTLAREVVYNIEKGNTSQVYLENS